MAAAKLPLRLSSVGYSLNMTPLLLLPFRMGVPDLGVTTGGHGVLVAKAGESVIACVLPR